MLFFELRMIYVALQAVNLYRKKYGRLRHLIFRGMKTCLYRKLVGKRNLVRFTFRSVSGGCFDFLTFSKNL